jgi:hypothetical protein
MIPWRIKNLCVNRLAKYIEVTLVEKYDGAYIQPRRYRGGSGAKMAMLSLPKQKGLLAKLAKITSNFS